MTRPTDAEISEQVDKAQALIEQGRTEVPGMTYEEGVAMSLQWALGDTDDKPMDP